MRVRLALPSQIPPWAILLWTTGLFIVQLYQGTSLYFAGCIFIYNFVFSIAFNLCGGLTSVNGLVLTSLATRTVIIGQFVKAALSQPADSFLMAAEDTAAVSAIGMFGLMVGLYLASKQRVTKPFFEPLSDPAQLRMIAILSLVLGALGYGTERILPQQGNNFIYGFLTMLKPFLSLAVITSTAAAILRSAGKRCQDWTVWLCLTVGFLLGVLAASKQSMYEPFLAWVLTSVVYRYAFRVRELLIIGVLVVLSLTVLRTLSDAGRAIYKVADAKESVLLLRELVTDPRGWERLREIETEHLASEGVSENYFGRPLGLWQRFALIDWTGRLIALTQRQGPEGIAFLLHSFSFLPRSITGDTQQLNPGNYFGHKVGFVDDGDEVTAVCFGIFADAFALLGWEGVLLLPALFFFPFFLAHRYLTTTDYDDIWKVFFFVLLHHPAAEAGIAFPLFHLVRVLPFLTLVILGLVYFSRGARSNTLAAINT